VDIKTFSELLAPFVFIGGILAALAVGAWRYAKAARKARQDELDGARNEGKKVTDRWKDLYESAEAKIEFLEKELAMVRVEKERAEAKGAKCEAAYRELKNEFDDLAKRHLRLTAKFEHFDRQYGGDGNGERQTSEDHHRRR
jgi:chromosome segregation ATPase